MKNLRFLLICLLLAAVMLSAIACNDVTDVNNGDGTEQSDSSSEGTSKETTGFTPDTEGFTIPENVQLDESAILASAAEAWDLTDGGTAGTVLSANGKTDATHKWGIWLNNNTFGRVLDFSTQGSLVEAEGADVDMSAGFAISAWVKAPIRESAPRVIASQESPLVRSYGNKTPFLNTESLDNWQSYTDLILDTEDFVEGAASVGNAISGAGDVVLYQEFDPIDLTGLYENGYLHMSIKIEGGANVSGGQIELTSGGRCDVGELTLPATVTPDGEWTDLYIKLSNGANISGFNPAGVNYFRMYFNSKGALSLQIDDVYFCEEVEIKEDDGWRFFINENGELDFTAHGMTGLEASGANIVDGKWHHVMASYDGETFIYYIDGTAVKACAVTGAPEQIGTALHVGASSDGSSHFDGSIAEFRFFKGPKTPGETTDTVLDVTDNEAKQPRMDMKKGLVIDRRQYYGADSRVVEPGASVSYDDITAIKNMGFDHVKLLLTPNHLINSDGSLKVEEMEYITWVMSHVTSQDFRAILCIHPESPFKETYLANLDQFELLCKWYGEIAQYIGEHWTADQVSFQLMTEPFSNNGSVEWSWMSDRMYGAVRNVLPDHTILTSSDGTGHLERIKTMSPATDDNLIYTFTTYQPYAVAFSTFIAQGNSNSVWAYIKEVPYPIEEGVDYTDAIEHSISEVPEHQKEEARAILEAYVAGTSDDGGQANLYDSLYNAEWHMLRAKSLDDWNQKYGGNIHLMCVEFGIMYGENGMARFGGQVMGVTNEVRHAHIKDMRTAFEAYNIGWSYWSYNEAFTIFDPEYALEAYGKFPDAETISQIVDYTMLEDSLGVTPLVKFEKTAAIEDAINAWKLNENGEELAKSSVVLGIKGKYVGTATEAYGDSYATLLQGDGSYIIAENTGIGLGRAFAIAADIKVENNGKIQTIISQGEGMWEDPDYVGKYMLLNCDSNAGMWGTAAISLGTKTEPVEGGAYLESAGGDLVVFCKAWNTPLDLSAYKDNGKLHISIYIEDASKVTQGSGFIELSSDTNLSKVTTWKLPALANGWNHLELDFKNCASNNADLSSIAMTRIFSYFTSSAYMGIDNMFVSVSGDVAPEIDWELIVNEAGELELKAEGLTGLGTSGVAVADGAWHKVLVSYDGKNVTYYLDGEQAASVEAGGVGAEVSGSSDTFIGANAAHKDTLAGAVANVAIYSAPKTPADIAE